MSLAAITATLLSALEVGWPDIRLQAVPFQCSMIARTGALFWEVPTAQMLLAETAATALRLLYELDEGLGPGTTRQLQVDAAKTCSRPPSIRKPGRTNARQTIVGSKNRLITLIAFLQCCNGISLFKRLE